MQLSCSPIFLFASYLIKTCVSHFQKLSFKRHNFAIRPDNLKSIWHQKAFVALNYALSNSNATIVFSNLHVCFISYQDVCIAQPKAFRVLETCTCLRVLLSAIRKMIIRKKKYKKTKSKSHYLSPYGYIKENNGIWGVRGTRWRRCCRHCWNELRGMGKNYRFPRLQSFARVNFPH